MNYNFLKNLGLLPCLVLPAASAEVLITDTFSRTSPGDPPAGWGMADNGLVGGENGTIAASYILDGGVSTDGSVGLVGNNRVVLDYNLATDASVIAGGGFVVEFQVNPGDGDDAIGETGLGREFAGVGIVDSNSNPPFGGAGAITNASNTTIRYAVLPRNSGSAGNLIRDENGVRTLTATGNPSSGGFNEEVFDQSTFDLYSIDTPDPFANDAFYDVRIEVRTDSFASGEVATINTSIDGVALAPQTISWGADESAYVSALAFNGPHQYDNLKVSAIPEPTSLALLAIGSLAMLRRNN